MDIIELLDELIYYIETANCNCRSHQEYRDMKEDLEKYQKMKNELKNKRERLP